jgi:3-oxoadipate enol-lactonase
VPTTQSPDGETLTYTVTGPPGRAPILTVHGLASSGQQWGSFAEHYARQRPLLAWEFRGHGGHPAPRDPASATIAQFAEDAHAVWQAARLPPVIVAGLSFGVQVALELWRRHPATVRALVLICGTAGHPLDRLSSSARVRQAAVGLVRGLAGRPWLARPMLASLRSPRGRRLACELAYATGGAHREACPQHVLDELFAHVADLDPRVLTEVVASYLAHDAFDVLPTITVPTLLITGDRDQLTPVATAERMQRAIPHSKLVVFPGHSHLVQVEKPREVHAAIDAFLADHAL